MLKTMFWLQKTLLKTYMWKKHTISERYGEEGGSGKALKKKASVGLLSTFCHPLGGDMSMNKMMSDIDVF